MTVSPTVLDFTAAFLASAPAWREPAEGPARRPPVGWRTVLVAGAFVLAAAVPVAVSLDAYRAEGAFRARCGISGGRVSFTGEAWRPYACVHG